ncbi:phage/plasmid primase, P4 family [Halorubrum sp. BV1]|uniref:phage/plasmid primase, P4 family n=1 Tax=Halorubrum sp. BV1 TaxID=1498500 RepID=UPI000679AB7B|nr:phage/plasmid primase, P4 family [Halorubrum sp. BV1]
MSEVEVAADEIPEELKERDQWLMWDASADAPRRPHWRGNFSVSWTDPDDWHSFQEAVEAAQERETWGIGYVFSNTNDDHAPGVYGALDLDGCADEDGRPKDWLPSLQSFFDEDAYMEFSPSGEGIHIPLVGFEPPEWWRDVHFTDEEHEGVEAYGKKFFTFTGDRLQGSGDEVADTGDYVEDWLIEAHKAVTGEDPTKERSADFEDASDGGRANREEFLDEDDIRDALDHVDPDVEYNTWRDIGFALADFFSSDHTALSVFEDWSRGGSKWDSEAEERAERIISDASSGGGRTIGTVIHHARQSGWEMPKTSSGPEHKRPPGEARALAEQEGDGGDDDEGDGETTEWEVSWNYVRDLYSEEGNDWGRYYAAEALDDRYSWMFVVESETLWVYDEDRGYFNRWGEQFVANVLERELGTHYSRSQKDEVLARLQARHQTHREELNARARDGHYLCVGNGVVDLATGDLHDHDPSYKFTRGLQWDYEPAKADPEPVVEFLDDITKREADRDTLLDHLAHGLMPGHPYRAFLITYGPGSNGKTQMGQLFRGFVGEDNAASVELQDLTGDDNFATGGLPGAFVNVGDDISVSEIRDVSILKSLTGGGTVRANEKYEKQYEFENEAAMFFSANEPPRISEESDAIGDRLYPIEMPYRFVDNDAYDPENPKHKKKTPGISQSLLDDERAMQGLLLLAVKHAQELIESNGQYSMPEGPKERRELYEAASDPIRRFALEYLEQADQGDLILKDDAFDVYKAMCEEQDERVASADGFKRQIAQQALLDVESARTRKLTPGDTQERCWRYIRFDEDAKDLMSPRLIERYFPGEEAGDDDDDGDEDATSGDESPVEKERAAFGATSISSAAEALTGYVTVTAEVAAVQRLGEEGNGVKAILKDTTGAMDLKTWEEDWSARLEDLEGETVVVENAEVYDDDYDGTRKLAPVAGLTDVQTIQQGVGHTEGEEPGDAQGQLDETPTQAEAEADGGQVPDVVDDLAPRDDEDDTTSSVPEDAEGMLADARRLVELLEQRGIALEEREIVVAASIDRDLMGPERAKEALEYAVSEKGLIMETEDGYTPV